MTPNYTSRSGRIRFYNCDCMELMESGKKWDLAVVDLEYNIGASNPSKKPEFVKQKNGNMLHVKSNQYTKKDWDNKLSSSEYINSLKNITSNQIVFGGNYYGLAGGYIVWDKLNGESDQFGCELAYQSFNKRTDIVRYMWQGMFQGVYCGYDIRKALIQQGDKRKNEERIHPTQKPIIIYRWILQKYAKAGDTILDTHGGSMSSAIACDMEGFELDICELDKEYFDKAVQRFRIYEQQQKLF